MMRQTSYNIHFISYIAFTAGLTIALGALQLVYLICAMNILTPLFCSVLIWKLEQRSSEYLSEKSIFLLGMTCMLLMNASLWFYLYIPAPSHGLALFAILGCTMPILVTKQLTKIRLALSKKTISVPLSTEHSWFYGRSLDSILSLIIAIPSITLVLSEALPSLSPQIIFILALIPLMDRLFMETFEPYGRQDDSDRAIYSHETRYTCYSLISAAQAWAFCSYFQPLSGIPVLSQILLAIILPKLIYASVKYSIAPACTLGGNTALALAHAGLERLPSIPAQAFTLRTHWSQSANTSGQKNISRSRSPSP
jgi:hypothetical protein